MKNLFKLFGIIALVAVIGFSFAACNMEGTTDNDGKTLDRFERTKDFDKVDYTVGDTFETAGLEMRLIYSDGSYEEDVEFNAETFTVSGYDMSKRGYQDVTITHIASGVKITGRIIVYPSIATKADFIDTWSNSRGSVILENSETEAKYTALGGVQDTFTITFLGGSGYHGY